MELLIPILGILLAATIVFTVFYFNYQESKNKHNALIEISKNIDDPSQLEELIKSLEDKKEPSDYRRSGVVTFHRHWHIYLRDGYNRGRVGRSWIVGCGNWNRHGDCRIFVSS